MKNVTKGKIAVREKIGQNGSFYRIETDHIGESICNIITRNHERALGNANLIADAFNTHNYCSLSPSELKQQRDELLEALREIKNAEHGTYKGTSTYLKKVASDAIDKALKLSNENT